MKEKLLKLTLEQLGQQAFPEDTDPWTPIQNRLKHNIAATKFKQMVNQPLQHTSHRQRMLIGIAMAFVFVSAILLLSPGGKALAETLRHLFRPVSVEELPHLSSEALASPTFAPTFAVTLAPAKAAVPVSTAIPDALTSDPESTFAVPAAPEPTGFSPTALSACNSKPSSYTCRIAQAEKVAGFDAKEFPADPAGFYFKTVASARPGEIWLEYDVIGGGGYLYLNQGLGSDFPAFTGAAEQSAIEPVQVGDDRGEYLFGDYVYGGVYTQTTWLPCCRARLRWTDGERWYELDKQAAMPQTDYMTRDVMVQMAAQLVDEPNPVLEPRADYLTSLEEASQLADFTIAAPSLLPDGFVFEYAQYDMDLSQLRLFYAPPGGQGVASVLIVETPLDKVSLAPDGNGEEIEGEAVNINGIPGIYFSSDPYSHALTWKSGEIKITLWVYSSEIWYGGSFTKDQILEIGKSVK